MVERHVRARTALGISVSSTSAIMEALAVGREQRPPTSSSQISAQEGRALEPSGMIDEHFIRRAHLARPASKVRRGVVVTCSAITSAVKHKRIVLATVRS